MLKVDTSVDYVAEKDVSVVYSIPISQVSRRMRVEPVLSSEDFWKGIEICVIVEFLDGKGSVISQYGSVLATGKIGNGDPPFIELANPMKIDAANVRITMIPNAPIGLKIAVSQTDGLDAIPDSIVPVEVAVIANP